MSRLPRVLLLALAPLALSSVAYGDRLGLIRPDVDRPQIERPQVERPQVDRAQRPDAGGRLLLDGAVDGGKASLGVQRNLEVRSGKPDIRPAPTRDSFIPTDENTGNKRALNSTHEVVQHGKPNLRPAPTRDAFTPVDETTGKQRGLNANREVKTGQPMLRPDPKRDEFKGGTDDKDDKVPTNPLKASCHTISVGPFCAQ